MQTFKNAVTIQRPAEELFAFLADFENIPMWNYAIEETRKASAGTVGVGTRYRQIRSVPGRSTESFEVTVFEPAIRLAIHGQIGPFQATISYELEARAGATRLVNNVELDPTQALLRLAAPLATPRIKAAVAQNLGQLKLVLEGGQPALGSMPGITGTASKRLPFLLARVSRTDGQRAYVCPACHRYRWSRCAGPADARQRAVASTSSVTEQASQPGIRHWISHADRP